MDAQVLPPPKEVGRWSFIIATIVLGCAGSLAGLAVAAQGTYVMGPFIVDLKVTPATGSTTQLSIAPSATGLNPGYAEADTHAGFLTIDAKVVGVASVTQRPLALQRVTRPRLLADSLKDEGKAAMRSFGIRAALGVVAGGAIGGGFMALFGFRPRRIVQGLLAGVILVGALALVAWQTYDVNEFNRTTFKPGTVALAPVR